MPRHTIVVDECPICGKLELGHIAFKREKRAGDEMECPGCEEIIVVGTLDEGWQSYYTFSIG